MVGVGEESNLKRTLANLRGTNLAWAIGCVGLGVVIWFVGIPCIFHDLTGLYCPGCGATRAVKALLHGNLSLAIHDNVWLILFAGPALFLSTVIGILSVSDRTREYVRRYLVITGYAAIVFFVLRNIHVAPFTLLAPLD